MLALVRIFIMMPSFSILYSNLVSLSKLGHDNIIDISHMMNLILLSNLVQSWFPLLGKDVILFLFIYKEIAS